MKPQEIRNLSKEELLEKEKGLYAELAKLNTQRYTGNVEKPHKFALVKRDIARIKTILNSVRGRAPEASDGCFRQPASNGVNEKKDK